MIFSPVYPALPQTCRDGAASVNRENSGYIATGLLEEDMAGLLCRWSIQVLLTSTIVNLYKTNFLSSTFQWYIFRITKFLIELLWA